MSLRNENPVLDEGDMRLKYKDKSETFTEDNLISKEPIGQFKAWYEDECNDPERIYANKMSLCATLRDCRRFGYVALFDGFDTEGFKFYAENDDDIRRRELIKNRALTFEYGKHRKVYIEGITRRNQEFILSKDLDHYFQSGPYANQIGSIYNEVNISDEDLAKVLLPESWYEYWDGYLVIPRCVEFWQGQSDHRHGIRFRRPKANEKIDNILVHKGENGWVYERLSPSDQEKSLYFTCKKREDQQLYYLYKKSVNQSESR